MADIAATSAHAEKKPRRGGFDKELRISWVAERVFLAWVRTSIALIALGFLLARIGAMLEALASSNAGAQALPREATLTGMVLISVGCIVSFVSTMRYHKTRRSIRNDEPVEHRSDLAYLVGLITPAIGVALIAFLWKLL